MIPSRVFVPQPPNPTQEDIFSSSLSSLFTDDTQNSHGTPGQSVVYSSPRYGDIVLDVPQHPDVEEGRKLFAHYLWNAGVIAADAIEQASSDNQTRLPNTDEDKVHWNREYWDVTGADVLELGAGTALPSIISALSGANTITITDHPSSPSLVNGTISQSVQRNLFNNPDADSTHTAKVPTLSSFAIAGLVWGDAHFSSAPEYGKPPHPHPHPQPRRNSFDKIIIADCLWMPWQHENIIKTVDMWLRCPGTDSKTGQESSTSTTTPCALVVAGFHTGRSVVASFFQLLSDAPQTNPEQTQTSASASASGPPPPLLSIAEIFEVDADLNRRAWASERPGESRAAAARWCVCAVLVRREAGGANVSVNIGG